MKVKVSDWIADYLVKQGIIYNFTVPGGGAMHLNVSFGHQEGMHNIFVQHEQSAAIAAEAYFRASNTLPLVCCTTGPGGTNTLTGVLGAWLDSIPMLVISGQVKYQTTVRSTMAPMRVLGDQEFDIVNVVKPMTKYAEMINNPRLVKYHIDKAIYLATHGRPGPVWLDIPLDVQWSYIDESEFLPFSLSEVQNLAPYSVSEKTVNVVIDLIKKAKRPVFYSGVELRTSGDYDLFLRVVDKLNIPVVTSFDGIDLMYDEHPLYFGRAGDVGNRYGNWTVQNSDLVLAVGTRLGIRQVSHATETWAREAFVIMVHPDQLELIKPRVHVELPICTQYKDFLNAIDNKLEVPLQRKKEWIDTCQNWKENYPVVDINRHYKKIEKANIYCFINELSKYLPEDINIVSANGSACVVGASGLILKKGQRFIINSGAASMGYDLPAALGTCFANNKAKTICLSGDGSIQMNLQELQTIVFHKLPIKIFVINNGGYHSMRQTQNNLFAGITNIGVGPETGDLSFPDMKKIAYAYDIPYMEINNNDEMNIIEDFISDDCYGICQVFVDTNQVFEPKPSAKKLEDGSLVSPPLEDLAPFLPREELKRVMIIPIMEDFNAD